MAEPLDTLQLKIQSDASAAAEGLKSLKDALSKLKSSVSRGQLNLANVADEISKFASAVNSVNIDKIERLAEAMTKIKSASSGFASGAKKAAKAAEEARKEAEKATDTGRSSTGRREQTGTASPEEHGNRGPWRRRTETVSGTDDREQRLQQARAILASAEQAREIVEQISSRIGPVVSKALGSVASYAKTIIGVVEGIGRAFLKCGEIAKTAFLAPMRYIANGVTKIYKTITGLIRSVARIALYRAIRTAIKAVTQGLNEGMQNLYQWSLLMDRTFANSMDSIASSMQYLHNGFASMFSPLINYAAPIIEEVTNRLVDFFNVVQQIFATLTGASTWTKAIRVQKQYAEAVTDTGKAADKAMHQVMAFDELNIINSPTDSGRAGVGANTPNYASMFVTQEVETGLKSWVAEIKKFFESGDFRGLGEYVGEKLNELVNKWNSYDKGFKFGERIKHALEALNGFLATFNFYNLGQKVGDWIAGLIDGMDPNLIAETIARSIDAAVSGLNGLISKLNERQVPQ